MFCDYCGTRVSDAARYCDVCGKTMVLIPLVPVASRIYMHIRRLGKLWLVFSFLRLIPALFFAIFRHPSFGFLPAMPFFLPGFVKAAAGVLLGSAVFGIIAGWGLLERQPWARVLAIVLACLNLLSMPFGTALGIYTLWVLLPARSEVEYRQISRAA